MNAEGDGIFAIKATCGLRAYGWHDTHQGRRVFLISHVVLKRRQGLNPADKARAVTAREEFRNEQRVQKTLGVKK